MTDTSDRLAEIRARLDAAKGISPGTNLAEKFGLAVSAGYAIRDNAADDLAFLLELVDQLQREYRELAEELGTDLAEESLPLAFSDRKRLLAEVDRLRAENARLAAQERASGPETTGGHPSGGTGVPGPHKTAQTPDLTPAEKAAADALAADSECSWHIGCDEECHTDRARAVVAAVRPHLATEPPVHDGIHHYLSTGCLHGDTVLPDGRTGHQYCQGMTGMAGMKRPATCKFCDAPCQCPCHQTNPEGTTR